MDHDDPRMADVAQRIGPGLVGILDQPFVKIGLMTLAVSAAIAWIASAFWCFRDTRARTRDLLAPYLTSGMVLLFSPALFPFGLVIYLLVRPQETSHERDLRMLARTALNSAVAQSSCPACSERIDRRWVRCPACATLLSALCSQCDRALDPGWSICPWCAAARSDTGMPAATAVMGARPLMRPAMTAPAPTVPAGVTPAGVTPAAMAPAAVMGALGGGTTLGPVPSLTSPGGSDTRAAASTIAAGTTADRADGPVAMGPGRSLPDDWNPQRASDGVPSPGSETNRKRLRMVREGVRTARSLGIRRPVTGARVVQSTSASRTTSALEPEAESLGSTHGVSRVSQP